MVRRLALLAVLVCVVLAGCAGTTVPPGQESPPGTDSRAGSSPATTTDGYYRAYDFSAVPATERDVVDAVALSRADAEADVTWRTQPFVANLFENGTATRVAIDAPDADDDRVPGLFRNGTFVRADGRVYRLEKTVVASHEGPSYLAHLEGPMRPDYHDNYSQAERVATNVSTLSAVDRRLVSYSIPSPDEREGALHSTGFTWVFPANASADDSRLVDGETHYVRDGDDLFAVDAQRQSGQAVRYRVRYRLVEVASVDDFTADSVDSYVTTLEGSTVDAPARGVLTEAIDRGTLEWSGRTATPDRIRSAAQWIQEHPPEGSVAFVRYDGELYRLEVTHAVE